MIPTVLTVRGIYEIEPLAVLLGLPGSTRAADTDDPYTYLNELKRCYGQG
jgi:hypothetical protein